MICQSKLQKLEETLAITQIDGRTSYLVGLAGDVLQDLSSSMKSELINVLARSTAFKQFKAKAFKQLDYEQDVFTIMKILMALHRQYDLSVQAGFSLELVTQLFKNYNGIHGQAQFDAGLDSLTMSGLAYVDEGMIWVPELWLAAIAVTLPATDFFQRKGSLHGYLATIVSNIADPQAWLQIGMISLTQKRFVNPIAALAKCLDTTMQQHLLDYLAAYVIKLVNPSILADAADHFVVDVSFIAKILEHVHALFENDNTTVLHANDVHAKLLPLLVDAITHKVCDKALEGGVILWNTAAAWKPLLDLSPIARSSFVAVALDQLLSMELEQGELTENIATVVSMLDIWLARTDLTRLQEIIALITLLPHSEDAASIMLPKLYHALFGEQCKLLLSEYRKSDSWHQSIQMTIQFLKQCEMYPGREDLAAWVGAAIELISNSQETVEDESIALIDWSATILMDPSVGESACRTFLKQLNASFGMPKLFFQVCLASIARYESGREGEGQRLRSLLQSLLSAIEDFEIFDMTFQLYVAFYLFFCTYASKSGWISQEAKKELEVHVAAIDEKLSRYAEELYVIDKLQWGRHFKQVLNSKFILPVQNFCL